MAGSASNKRQRQLRFQIHVHLYSYLLLLLADNLLDKSRLWIGALRDLFGLWGVRVETALHVVEVIRRLAVSVPHFSSIDLVLIGILLKK